MYVAQILSCPVGKLYDSRARQCKLAIQVDCGSRRRPAIFILCFICADAIVLRSSSEEDSNESSSSEEKGKLSQNWNRGKWDRDWNRDKDKDKKDKKIKFECPAPNGVFPDTSDCSRYYVCVMKKAKNKKCDRKYNFDMFRKTCLPKIIAVCDDGKGKPTPKATTVNNMKSTTPKDHFTCPDNFGTFPHPEDCTKFYDCFFFLSNLKTCPDKTLFDGAKKQCKPESQVNCGARRRPTTHQPGTSRHVTPSLRTSRPTKPTPSKLSTMSRSTKDNTRSTWDRTSTLKHTKPTKPHKSTPSRHSTPNTPRTRKPTTFKDSSTKFLTDPTTLKVTSEPPTTVSSTTEELTTLQITTEKPTTSEEISTTQVATTVEEISTTEVPTTREEITTTEISTTREEITTTQVPTTREEITTTEVPTTLEEITSTTVEPTGPPETNCDEDDLDCIIKETGEIPRWFKCPDDIGSFPHPSSPKLFIFCKNKKPKVKKCGQNLIYSDSLKTCVAP